jgi:oxygen-independent coproporphyrinogen-3 oxidase
MTTPGTLARLGVTAETIAAQDKRIPRYTSYPTAPSWTTDFGPDEFRDHLQATSTTAKPLSLYVHIPFCQKRCLFCACNVIVTRKDWVADDYLDVLEKEIALGRSFLQSPGKAIQLHLGGGTPNFLSHEQMARLLAVLARHFEFAPDAERSIEIDPRLAKPEEIARYHDEHGYRRISFGTQDFHEETQHAIGREQTLEITFANVRAARQAGFRSVNIDLIYGLPMQTAASWSSTIDAVLELRPDRIALYNFAFLPGLLSHQRQLDESQLPPPSLKLEMFTEAHDRLTTAGWEFIGMDHYALKDDSLVTAQHDGTLRRNFMGYTTLRGTDMLAFGVSAISDFEGAFAQNVKKLTTYNQLIEAGKLPVERGLKLSADDLLRRHIIEEIMCNGLLRLDSEPLREAARAEEAALQAMADDWLLELLPDEIRVTPKGRLFLRNIAAVFDAYLKKPADKPLFSRSV